MRRYWGSNLINSIMQGYAFVDQIQKDRENEQFGNALAQLVSSDYDARNKAALSAAGDRVTGAAAPMSGVDYSKIMNIASGDPEAVAELAKLNSIQRATEGRLIPSVQNYNEAQTVYTNPISSLKGLNGSQMRQALPFVMSLDANRVNQYKSDQAERRRQALLGIIQSASTPDERRSAALQYQAETGKPLDYHLINGGNITGVHTLQDGTLAYIQDGQLVIGKKGEYAKQTKDWSEPFTDSQGNTVQKNLVTGEIKTVSRASKNSGYDKVQIAQAQKDVAAHHSAYKEAVKLDPEIDETKLPTYGNYRKAQDYLGGNIPYYGGVQGSQSGEKQSSGGVNGLDYNGFYQMFNNTLAHLENQGVKGDLAVQQAKTLALQKGFPKEWIDSLR